MDLPFARTPVRRKLFAQFSHSVAVMRRIYFELQSRPTSEQRAINLFPIMDGLSADFCAVFEIRKMLLRSFPECKLRVAWLNVRLPIPMSRKKFSEPRLRKAVMRCSERLPNLFAAPECSGIVASRFMANQISVSCSSPVFFALRGFTRPTAERRCEKHKRNVSNEPIYVGKLGL